MSDIKTFIEFGGNLSFAEWQGLTEEQKQDVKTSYSRRNQQMMIYFAILLTKEYEKEHTYQLAKLFSAFDGGELEKTLRLLEIQTI